MCESEALTGTARHDRDARGEVFRRVLVLQSRSAYRCYVNAKFALMWFTLLVSHRSSTRRRTPILLSQK